MSNRFAWVRDYYHNPKVARYGIATIGRGDGWVSVVWGNADREKRKAKDLDWLEEVPLCVVLKNEIDQQARDYINREEPAKADLSIPSQRGRGTLSRDTMGHPPSAALEPIGCAPCADEGEGLNGDPCPECADKCSRCDTLIDALMFVRDSLKAFDDVKTVTLRDGTINLGALVEFVESKVMDRGDTDER